MIMESLSTLSLLLFLVVSSSFLSFAAYRLTQFFVFDSLIGFSPESGSSMSSKVDRFAYYPDLDSEHRRDDDGPPGADRSFLRGKIGDLLTCPWCLGFWISVACYLGFFISTGAWPEYPLAVHFIAAFAVAGGQGFLNAHTD